MINLKSVNKTLICSLLFSSLFLISNNYTVYANTNKETIIELDNTLKDVYKNGESITLSGEIGLTNIKQSSIRLFLDNKEMQLDENNTKILEQDNKSIFNIKTKLPYDIDFGKHIVKLLVDNPNNTSSVTSKEIVVASNNSKSSNNIDLYIQPNNELTLSLDTNTITFDDFDGLRDIVNDNAITLTINSILPYEVNAYLESEIANKDKTKTMDKNILKIKSSQTQYQSFLSVNDKIKLLDVQNPSITDVWKIGIMLKSGIPYKTDTYKAVIRFEVLQK